MKQITIMQDKSKSNRIEFGISMLESALRISGYDAELSILPDSIEDYRTIPGPKIFVGSHSTSPFLSWAEEENLLVYHDLKPTKEGFYIQSLPGRLTVISGGCDTGALYGCQELAHRITIEGELPREIAFGDAPVYKLRGPAIGLQKTHIEPPRLTYEYPITPSRFPWFYDRAYWIEYLDLLTEWRCNVLNIWSGHPFSSLVRLADYPEALEVTEEEFALNRAMLNWLTEESDRRGIWIVFLFYNNHIPLPFTEKHGLPLLQNSINPLVARYTYESIAEFVKTFPNVGLMVCLGEALRGIQNKTAWFIDTIIPAVKEGMRRGGLTEEPPLILRGHDCDPIDAIGKAAGLYNNLYTMWKYNGEGLTTYFPIGNWQERYRQLSSLKSTHIINVHILANLESFRFNAPAFIQKCAQAGQYRLGANGLYLYSFTGTGRFRPTGPSRD